jgi:hypothetical protein
MCDQNALIILADVNVSLDQITAVADVRRDFRGQVAHSGM